MLSLAKNPLFGMLDTETIFLKKRAYEIALVIFDSVTCKIIASRKWYIRETIDSAIYYQLRHNKTPIFWPARLNALSLLKESVPFDNAINEFLLMLKKNDVKTIIAHNVNFDVSAIYSTANIYSEHLAEQPFLASYEKLELSGFFIHGLPLMAAYNVPFKAKSGCMTFKADFLVPALIGGSQNHDALGDCTNQIELYKLAIQGGTVYQNQGTIYSNMLAHHRVKHDDNKRLGDSSLD